jgi:hypothetical protein
MNEQFQLPESPISLKERVALVTLLRDKPHYRELIRERCKEDKIFFINLFGYTFDPRDNVKVHDIPFMMDGRFRYQIDGIHWFDELVDNQTDGVMDKTRDMGATWIFVAWLCHKWLFEDGFQALIGSRKEDLVDNWTLDSHFGKIAYFLEKLPRWMLPKGYNPGVHRMKLKVVNPENGNVIIGESANANFSRQGRYTVIIFDEAAFWEDLASSFRAASQSSPTRILISTPGGPPEQNDFAAERFSGRHSVLTLHYSLDPTKDENWARTQRARMTAEDAAQEIDINYHRSGRGLVYPSFVNVARGEYPYEKGYSLFVTWDFGVGDETAIVWIARNNVSGGLRFIDCYSNKDKAIDFYVPFINGFKADDNNYDYTELDWQIINDHAHLPKATHYGDPDVYKRSMSHATSAYQILVEHGIVVMTNTKDNDFADRKRKTEMGIKRIEGINWPNCADAYTAVANARFPQRKPSSQSTSEITKPIHDNTAHFRTAVEYFFVNEPPFMLFEMPVAQRKTKAYDMIGRVA